MEANTLYRDATTPVVSPDEGRMFSRRPGRELFPSSWMRREVRISYDDGSGAPKAADLSGVLLEFCGAGLIVQADGSKNLLPWERFVLVELVES